MANQQALTPTQKATIKCLDNCITAAMIRAEGKCQKFAMGQVDFSPTIQTKWETKLLWKLIMERKEGKKRGQTKMRCLAKKLQIRKPKSYSLPEVTQQYREACAAYQGSKLTMGISQAKISPGMFQGSKEVGTHGYSDRASPRCSTPNQKDARTNGRHGHQGSQSTSTTQPSQPSTTFHHETGGYQRNSKDGTS